MHEQNNFELLSTLGNGLIQAALIDLYDNPEVQWTNYASPKLASSKRRVCLFKRFPALPVRPDGQPGYYAPKEWADQCVLTGNFKQCPNVVRIINTVMEDFGYTKLGLCLVSEMQHGAEVAPHSDEGEYFDQFHRIHVVLKAPIGPTFTIGGENKYLPPWTVWKINNKVEHSVKVDDVLSGINRVNLYFDAV